jgi:hypothetical protein
MNMNMDDLFGVFSFDEDVMNMMMSDVLTFSYN